MGGRGQRGQVPDRASRHGTSALRASAHSAGSAEAGRAESRGRMKALDTSGARAGRSGKRAVRVRRSSRVLSGLLPALVLVTWASTGAAAAPGSIAETIERARALVAADAAGDAAALLAPAIEAWPDVPALRNEQAVALVHAGRLAEAREVLDAALQQQPAYHGLHRNLQDVNRALALEGYRTSLGLPVNGHAGLTLRQLPVEPARVGVEEDTVPMDSEPRTSGDAGDGADDESPPQPDAVAEGTDTAGAPEDFVRGWADAWSDQDVDAYLAAYVDGYSDAASGGHAAWRALRESRLLAPAWIEVALDGLSVQRPGPDTALAFFDQRYRSDSYGDRTRKLLILARQGGRWRIEQELVIQ